MTLRLRAIETRYNGYRFRSRLEARWAVFLDAIGVNYEYEPQGFALPSGAYLPDFWIPSWEAWLEIKPAGQPLLSHPDAKKWRELAQASHDVLVIAGNPWPQEHAAYCVDPNPQWDMSWERCSFGQCRKCDAGVAIGTHEEGAYILTRDCCEMALDRPPLLADQCPLIISAYIQARGARFEHGEKP